MKRNDKVLNLGTSGQKFHKNVCIRLIGVQPDSFLINSAILIYTYNGIIIMIDIFVEIHLINIDTMLTITWYLSTFQNIL